MADDPNDPVVLARQLMASLELTQHVDPQLIKTPERFVGLLQDLFQGLERPEPTLSVFEAEDMSTQPVLLKGLRFQSMCVHHLLPFFGTIDVAYVPNQRIVGFGSIPRIIEHFAARPQMQERMVKQIADYLEEHLQPQGLLIRCRARQLCMEYRGEKAHGELISYAARGCLINSTTRTEILAEFAAHNNPI